MVGWGQVLSRYVSGWTVMNRAFAGRSTRSFLAEGRLRAMEADMAPGDLLLIQFGHNDASDRPERHTEPWTSFTENLRVFADTAQAHGCIPVLLTPICIRCWREGRLQPSHGEYLQAVRALADVRSLSLVDLYEASFRAVEALGEEGSKAFYMQIPPGLDPRYPEGLKDDTHTRRAGAEYYARVVSKSLRALGLISEGSGMEGELE